jgi:hypothetical protein
MLSQTIPCYVYYEFSDDENIQAFFSAANAMTQQYVSWFNQISLPIYTGLSGTLLDWIANNLYGYYRPTLGGALVSDDIMQRCMTWQLYKGDGKTFNIEWLKRRVMRFLTGANGTDPGINQTYQISVTFGAPNIVYINILPGVAVLNGGAIFNAFQFNQKQFNEIDQTVYNYLSGELPIVLQEALNSRVIEFPFQYQAVVSVNT